MPEAGGGAKTDKGPFFWHICLGHKLDAKLDKQAAGVRRGRSRRDWEGGNVWTGMCSVKRKAGAAGNKRQVVESFGTKSGEWRGKEKLLGLDFFECRGLCSLPNAFGEGSKTAEREGKLGKLWRVHTLHIFPFCVVFPLVGPWRKTWKAGRQRTVMDCTSGELAAFPRD